VIHIYTFLSSSNNYSYFESAYFYYAGGADLALNLAREITHPLNPDSRAALHTALGDCEELCVKTRLQAAQWRGPAVGALLRGLRAACSEEGGDLALGEEPQSKAVNSTQAQAGAACSEEWVGGAGGDLDLALGEEPQLDAINSTPAQAGLLQGLQTACGEEYTGGGHEPEAGDASEARGLQAAYGEEYTAGGHEPEGGGGGGGEGGDCGGGGGGGGGDGGGGGGDASEAQAGLTLTPVWQLTLSSTWPKRKPERAATALQQPKKARAGRVARS